MPLRLCRVETVPLSIRMLLRDQIGFLAKAGFSVTMIASPGPDLDALAADLGVESRGVEMQRMPSPWKDLDALVKLTGEFRRGQFDIVHSTSPKAGFLTAIAGRLARIPVRLHTYTGQPWVELRGATRLAARVADRVIAGMSTHTYADSFSQRQFLLDEGIVRANQVSVLGAGSLGGFDSRRFSPERRALERAPTRRRLHISEDTFVAAFVGRLTVHKGVVELVDAFRELRQRHRIALILVGPIEHERNPLPPRVVAEIQENDDILSVGMVDDPGAFLAIADLLILPSYREGFGSAALEASAVGLPVVATRIPGLCDAVEDGVTGLLVPPKETAPLVDAIERLILDDGFRNALGTAGAIRAARLFSAETVNGLVAAEYRRLSDARVGKPKVR